MTLDLKQIKARRQAITMGEGDWHRVKYEDDGSLMPGFLSAGQSKEGYSLDVIISECEKSENIDFICHCPVDVDNLVTEIERFRTAMQEIITESGKVDINNWPAQQQICQSIARKALEIVE